MVQSLVTQTVDVTSSSRVYAFSFYAYYRFQTLYRAALVVMSWTVICLKCILTMVLWVLLFMYDMGFEGIVTMEVLSFLWIEFIVVRVI